MKTYEIQLTQGLVAFVDCEDFEMLSAWKWCAHRERSNTYAVRRHNGKIVRMHRFILQADGLLDVDHIDGNGLNNRRGNLRAATRQQNLFNQTKKTPGCSSQYRGVCWVSDRNRWVAYIMADGRRKHLGYHLTELDAALAHDRAGFERDPRHFTPNIKK